MNAVIVIPARYASSRFPGKPLVQLKGADGVPRSLIERSWRAAMASKGAERVIIATDDDRIAEEGARLGAEIVMTSEECRNGTERCAEVAAQLTPAPDVVVNLQGDAPLTPPWFVEALIERMRAGDAEVATPVLRCDAETLANLREDRRNDRVGATTAVFDRQMRALYFSKEVLPFGAGDGAGSDVGVFHHVGLYAYTPAALKTYEQVKPSALELAEGLEQLRFMEAGVPVHCVEVEARDRVFWEVNNPEDVPRVEGAMQRAGIS